jgi:hypothetical protein
VRKGQIYIIKTAKSHLHVEVAARVLRLWRSLLLLLLLLLGRRGTLGRTLGPEQLGRVRVRVLQVMGRWRLVMLQVVGRRGGEGGHEVLLAAAHHVHAGLQEDDATGSRAHG